MPSASETMAMAVTKGVLKSARMANLRVRIRALGRAKVLRRLLIPVVGGAPVEVVGHFPVAQRQLAQQTLVPFEALVVLIDKAEAPLLRAQDRDVGTGAHRKVPQLF